MSASKSDNFGVDPEPTDGPHCTQREDRACPVHSDQSCKLENKLITLAEQHGIPVFLFVGGRKVNGSWKAFCIGGDKTGSLTPNAEERAVALLERIINSK